METILEKIEKAIDKYIEDFQANPVRTGLKLMLAYWLIRFIWKDVKSWGK